MGQKQESTQFDKLFMRIFLWFILSQMIFFVVRASGENYLHNSGLLASISLFHDSSQSKPILTRIDLKDSPNRMEYSGKPFQIGKQLVALFTSVKLAGQVDKRNLF